MLTQVAYWWETFQRQMIVVDLLTSFKTYDDKSLSINYKNILINVHFPTYPGLHHQSSFVALNWKKFLVDSCVSCVKSGNA